jgi:hypothetical protein
LLAGFLVIFAVWPASTFYFTRRSQNPKHKAQPFMRNTRTDRSCCSRSGASTLGSIYLRDALIETGQSSRTRRRPQQLRHLQARVNQGSSVPRDGFVDEGVARNRLEGELRDYWDAAVRVVTQQPDDPMAAQRRLQTEVIPKRDGIVHLSEDIRQVMAANATREQHLSDANVHIRRRIWETTAIAVGLGVVIAILSTWHVGRLEATVREEHDEVARNRQELRHLSGRLVRAQEDERRSIARELHDEIGQALTAVDVELAVAQGAVSTDGRAAAAIREARTVAQRALGGVRDLSQLLRPSMLDDFGLPDERSNGICENSPIGPMSARISSRTA